jgi:hypothetical protein
VVCACFLLRLDMAGWEDASLHHLCPGALGCLYGINTPII